MKPEENSKQTTEQVSVDDSAEVSALIVGLKFVESFLLNVIWGILIKCLFIRIPKFIFNVCKTILTFIYDVVKAFFTWFFRNFGKIAEVFYRVVKITLLLAFLAALILWPLYFHPLLLAAWGVLIVVPGVTWGIIRWRRQQKNKQKENEVVTQEQKENEITAQGEAKTSAEGGKETPPEPQSEQVDKQV